MNHVVIVWKTEAEIGTSNGEVYGWYENLVTAINTALNLTQSGYAAKAVGAKVL